MDDSFHDPKTEDDYIERIRDFSKELTGSRDTYGEYGKIEHMNLAQLKDYYEGMFNSPEAQALKDKEQSDADASLGRDTDYDRMPKKLGMGRMESTMKKVNEGQLKNLIRKEVKRLLEGRYHFANSFDELDVGEDPRVQAFEQCIKILNELTYDSLEDEVASMADEAARALWKAAGELDYKRNQVGNIDENERMFNEVFNSEGEN